MRNASGEEVPWALRLGVAHHTLRPLRTPSKYTRDCSRPVGSGDSSNQLPLWEKVMEKNCTSPQYCIITWATGMTQRASAWIHFWPLCLDELEKERHKCSSWYSLTQFFFKKDARGLTGGEDGSGGKRRHRRDTQTTQGWPFCHHKPIAAARVTQPPSPKKGRLWLSRPDQSPRQVCDWFNPEAMSPTACQACEQKCQAKVRYTRAPRHQKQRFQKLQQGRKWE